MPSGSTHDRITLWSLPWIVGLTYVLLRDGELTLILGGGFLFSGLMFGPDLDIYSIQFKRWGKIRWIWLPYQKTLNHRSPLSHGFLLGTTLRILYLLSLLLLLGIVGVAVAQGIWGFEWNWRSFAEKSLQFVFFDYRLQAIALFAGLELGSISHSLSDSLVSTYKKVQRQGWKALKPKSKSTKARSRRTGKNLGRNRKSG